ncbi:fungal specific transcription factor domain-containing protein [Aspergillus undulatus]|uniref:fungal specific transcription factor domain-containing protein n=1 Tax=Aspergillus undulatus TaxID=1810928 RepID=UPI003CCE4480
MFPSTTLAARRRRIATACDFCRRFRIRCEAVTPCPPCVANNVASGCRRPPPSHTPRKKSKKGKPLQNSSEADRQISQGPPGDDALASDIQRQVVDASAPSLSPTDSILGFIARINSFCSGVSQLSPNATAPGSDTSLDQISPFSSSVLQETRDEDCDLSINQIRHLMRIFWSHLRPLMPIVEWNDLDSSSGRTPLQDAIVAFSLHYIYHSGLRTRLVGLDWPQFQRRHLSAVTRAATFAGPSLSVIQCYCYLTLYLLDVGEHQAAYNMVGLALRIAQSLNYLDARHRGQQVCQLFRRLWWTLIHLDFRCSRYVGKPVTMNSEDILYLRPSREPQDIHLANGLLYHTESIRLTAAALVVNGTMGHHSFLDGATGPAHLETRAKALSDCLHHLQKWRDELPQEQSFANLHLVLPDVPLDPSEPFESDDYPMHQPSMVTLLNTLLLLQYHNVVLSLHRIFIQFPSAPFTPKSHPNADAHATTALNHALAMIRIAHHRMGIHDFLHGLSELYQNQWNAVITIIGFMLAYPYCHRCARAREHLDLALEIFDAAGRENPTAARAAVMTRHLCGKVNVLVRILSPGQAAPVPAPAIMENQPVQNLISGSRPVSPAIAISNGGTPLPDRNADGLCPWADLINLDTWPNYCDEVTGAFMYPADFMAPPTL